MFLNWLKVSAKPATPINYLNAFFQTISSFRNKFQKYIRDCPKSGTYLKHIWDVVQKRIPKEANEMHHFLSVRLHTFFKRIKLKLKTPPNDRRAGVWLSFVLTEALAYTSTNSYQLSHHHPVARWLWNNY